MGYIDSSSRGPNKRMLAGCTSKRSLHVQPIYYMRMCAVAVVRVSVQKAYEESVAMLGGRAQGDRVGKRLKARISVKVLRWTLGGGQRSVKSSIPGQ